MFGTDYYKNSAIIFTHGKDAFVSQDRDLQTFLDQTKGDFKVYLNNQNDRAIAVDLPISKYENMWFKKAILNIVMLIQEETGSQPYTNATFQAVEKKKKKNVLAKKRKEDAKNEEIMKQKDEESLKYIKQHELKLLDEESRRSAIIQYEKNERYRNNYSDWLIKRNDLIETEIEQYVQNHQLTYDFTVPENDLNAIVNRVDHNQPEDAKDEANFTKADIREKLEDLVVDKRNELQEAKCFPADSLVICKDIGKIKMENLALGDDVLTCDLTGQLKFEPIILFSHGDKTKTGQYLTLSLSDSSTMSLSSEHLIHVGKLGNLKAASQLQVDDIIFVADNAKDTVTHVSVVAIKVESKKGMFAPHTTGGSIVVDGVVASCYTTVLPPVVAHAMLLPARWLHALLPLSWYRWLFLYDKEMGMPTLLAKYRHIFMPKV